MIVVAAALGDHVDDRARGLAKLSAKTGSQHLKLRDCLLVKLRCSAAEDGVFVWLTVDQKVVVAGTYSLGISHTGFATRNFENIELTVNRTLTLDIPLEVGAVSEQVDVVENAQLLNPTTASTGATTTACVASSLRPMDRPSPPATT